MKKKFIVFAIILLNISIDSLAIYPVNLLRFDNIFLQPYCTKCGQLDLSVLAEVSANVKGRNFNGDKVNALNIWNSDQDSLAMLRGFNPNSTIGQLATALNAANDDGIRGHFDINGNFHINSTAFIARYYLPKGFFFDLFMPFYFMELKSLELKDKTKFVTYQDLLTHELLTDPIKDRLLELGNLKAQNWQKSGPGDLVLSLWWKKDFPQEKPWLKSVRTIMRAGVTVPTGLKGDISDFDSIPFTMGSAGVFLGGNLEATWANCVKLGVDLQFLYLFGKTEQLRIKTDENQTDIFLLARCNAFRSFGVTQEYFIYLQTIELFKRASFKLAYNYLFHQDDELFLTSNTFSTNTANTAKYLEEWTIHSFLIFADYQWKNKKDNGAKLTLFWRQPFNGKKSVQAVTFGAQFSVLF